VDANPATPGVDELKEWQALIGFISMLPDTGGNTIPNIALRYPYTKMPSHAASMSGLSPIMRFLL